MNNNRTTCDSKRIELFLQQKLSDEEQTAFELHLDDCNDCRHRLEATAAGDDIWSGVRDSLLGQQLTSDYLRPDDPALDSAAGDDASSSHDAVLKLLAPTDDDRSLGRLGTYEVVGVIGSGGMGVVLKAFDAALNRYVAIKVLAPHLGSSGAARKRFSREAQAAAAVVHDNVMEIYGVVDTAGLSYLVMPYVRGPSLQRRLDDDGPLALVEILRVGMQAAAGLAAAHAQGLVHRDVKPANILLADGIERVRLTDFGLARAADDVSLTKTGIIAGTPQYMSPEQARGESVDQRSDLFSLGSVLYAMCTSRAPFRAETSYGVLRRVTDEEPRAIREINPDIPEWLCRIVARLMSKQPGERFASAREVAALLEECLAHVQQPTAVPLPAALPKPVPRRGWWPPVIRFQGILAMIAALGAGLLGVLLLSTAPPDIAGQWSGDDWGQVVLKKTSDAEYTGTYTGTVSKQAGEIQLQWSRIERRFNGTWREGEDRFGELSVRLSGEEIRGALTTDPKSKINPATPRLADLTWIRAKPAAPLVFGPVIERVIATPDADDQGMVFFDLETGKSFKPPFALKFYPNTGPAFVALTPELVQWIKARDVDLLCHLAGKNWDIMTLGMQENYAGELKEWETLSPDEVVRMFAEKDADHLVRHEEPSSSFGHSSRGGFGSFDAFMTRSNTMGVYRFEDVDMSKSTSRGVQIRYKLVQYTPLTPGAVGGEQDPTVAELRGLGAQLVAKGEAGDTRAEKPADFTSISYSISHPLGWNVPEQIEVMADGSCVYTIQKRPARGQEKERPSGRQTFNLGAANLRRLEKLLEKTDWLTAPGGEGRAMHTDAETLKLVLVRKGQPRSITCEGQRPEPYKSLLSFFQGLAHQENQLYRLTWDLERPAVCESLTREIRGLQGIFGNTYPLFDIDYTRYVPFFTEVLQKPDGKMPHEIEAAVEMVRFLGIKPQTEALVRLADNPEHNVRTAVAKAMADLGGAEVVPALVAMCRSTEEARWSLVRLGDRVVPTIAGTIAQGSSLQDRDGEHMIRTYLDHWLELPGPIDNRIVEAARHGLQKTRGKDNPQYYERFLELVASDPIPPADDLSCRLDRWTAFCPKPVRLIHGWYVVADGRIVEHGSAPAPEAGTKVFRMVFKAGLADGRLKLEAGWGAAGQWHFDVPLGSQFEVAYDCYKQTPFASGGNPVRLSGQLRTLWEGRFVTDGQVVKRIVYAARVAGPNDPARQFAPPAEAAAPKGEPVRPRRSLTFRGLDPGNAPKLSDPAVLHDLAVAGSDKVSGTVSGAAAATYATAAVNIDKVTVEAGRVTIQGKTEESREVVVRAQRIARNIKVIAEGENAPKPLPLLKGPLLRHRSLGNYVCGTVWGWGEPGRPEALLSLSLTGPPAAPSWCHEMVSLSTRPIRATTRTQTWWATEAGAWSPQAIPNAAPPAENADQRFGEMKALAKRFAALRVAWLGDELSELVLLPEPILRYGNPSSPSIDGGLFVFVEGINNPEVLLVIEAEKQGGGVPSWKYHLARLSANGLVVKLQGKEVWKQPEIEADSTQVSDLYRIFFVTAKEETEEEESKKADSDKQTR
jgi:hypothetical protein